MEYLLGSVMTIISLYFVRVFFLRNNGNKAMPAITFSQSRIFDMTNPYMATNIYTISPETQSSKYEDSQRIPVVLTNEKAYWILNSTFFEADQVNGEIKKESTKPVDIMGMNKVQLEKMMFIVEQLTEGGKDENRNSGK